MSNSSTDPLNQAIHLHWRSKPGEKAQRYINQFTHRVRTGTKIVANVVGNHGTYTVSIQVTPQGSIHSACSCYIGSHGYCHHCEALAVTFLRSPDSFLEKETKPLDQVEGIADLPAYLDGVTLEDLLAQLKEKGISQKVFAESMGMSTQHLSAVKRSELRNRKFHELGATKLACLWVMERYGQISLKKKSK